MIPVLILAAGQSARMRGTDKLMQDVHGQPLLLRQIKRARHIGPVFVALPNADHPRLAAIGNATPLFIPESCEGIGGTLRGAVKRLPAGPFMLLLPDLIDLDSSDLTAILNASREHPDCLIWRGATPDGKAGHPIIFAASLRPEFEKLHGDTGAKSVINPLKSRSYLHKFPDNRARNDLDTPADWDAWQLKK